MWPGAGTATAVDERDTRLLARPAVSARHVAPQDGKGPVRVFSPGGAGFYGNLRQAPDSAWLAYTRNTTSDLQQV